MHKTFHNDFIIMIALWNVYICFLDLQQILNPFVLEDSCGSIEPCIRWESLAPPGSSGGDAASSYIYCGAYCAGTAGGVLLPVEEDTSSFGEQTTSTTSPADHETPGCYTQSAAHE